MAAHFQKLIFRVTRGKVLTYFSQSSFTVRDSNNEAKQKIVYVLVF
jgi:hypothetical protein